MFTQPSKSFTVFLIFLSLTLSPQQMLLFLVPMSPRLFPYLLALHSHMYLNLIRLYFSTLYSDDSVICQAGLTQRFMPHIIWQTNIQEVATP